MKYVESLNTALHDLFGDSDNILLIGEDLVDPYGGAFKVSKGLSTQYGDRVITMPISEAAFTGFAIGLALGGYRPIVEIMFGDFITLCADQIVNGASKIPHMYKDKIGLPLTIRTPMGGRRGYGPTHSQSLESLFFTVPNITITAPSILHDPGTLLRTAVLRDTPDLFVENKSLYAEELYSHKKYGNYRVETHGQGEIATCVIDGVGAANAAIIAYGGMVKVALEALETLFVEHEIIAEVISPATIKPLPSEQLAQRLADHQAVVIAEESVAPFGWGAEVSSQLYERRLNRPVIRRIGAKEIPIPNALPLEQQVLPQAAHIVEAIRAIAA